MKFPQFLFVLIFLLASCSTDKESQEQTIEDEDGNEEVVDVSQNRRNVGDSANDMLSSDNFDEIEFELFFVDGFRPSDNTIANFEEFVTQRLNKPAGITINLKQLDSPGQAVYSISDIRALEDDIRTKYNNDKRIAIFGLFLDGEYSENTNNGTVLGVAYRNTSFVLFQESIQSFSGQPLSPSTTVLETTVLNHEFGHLLGLVNAGTPLQSDHQDVENGRHCTVDDCLMFWTAETGEGLVNMISGGTIPSLDSQCLADLQANGGK